MDAAVAGHLVLEELVDDAVAGGLRAVGREGVGGDDEPEVRLARGAARHGPVVRVLGRVVEDVQARGLEGRRDLWAAERNQAPVISETAYYIVLISYRSAECAEVGKARQSKSMGVANGVESQIHLGPNGILHRRV